MKTPPEVRVLVVEDDPFFQRVLQKRLTSEGYQVQVAGDGREGMKAIVTFEPDLVVSDWMMPQVDGLELCQSVKTGLREAAPYFILLTAKGEISDKLLGLQTGADDYLTKPCDQGELMARVRAGVRIVTLTQELRRTVADLKSAATGEAGSPSGAPVALCPGCRRIRSAEGTWTALEALAGNADPSMLCPACAESRLGPGGAPPDAAAA